MRETAARRIDLKFLAITAAMAVLILYGSFYPFHFSMRPGSPLETLLFTRAPRSGRSDVLSNLILYFPLGFFGALVFSRSPRARYLLPVTAAAAALSFTVELLQFYDKSRVSSLTDVYVNTAGALLGAAVSVAVGRHVHGRLHRPGRQSYFVILLLGCWFAFRLFPYVPTIDPHQYWGAVKPLIFAPRISLQGLYRHFATGLVVAAAVEALLGAARSRVIAPGVLLGVLCLRITITGVTLSPAEVLGSLAAAVSWACFISRLQSRIPLLAVLVALMIAVEALAPFRFLPVPRAFGWMPFRALLRGSVAVNTLAFFEKAFHYGALPWLLHRSGWRISVATGVAAVFVLILRLGQCYLPGRSAEITDAVMVVLLGGLMGLLSQPRRALP